MHELSIADCIVRIALRHAGGRRVYSVEVSVGYLRQVVPSSLEFAFELLANGTPLEGATLRLNEIAPRGRCRACGSETEMTEFPLQCGDCGGLDLDVLAGEELLVDALELEEKVTTEGMAHGG
jgi:hydrogenase nickel incorporation protein HypA/HybF